MKKIFNYFKEHDRQNIIHLLMATLCEGKTTIDSITIKMELDNQFNELLQQRKAKAIEDLEKIEEYYGN